MYLLLDGLVCSIVRCFYLSLVFGLALLYSVTRKNIPRCYTLNRPIASQRFLQWLVILACYVYQFLMRDGFCLECGDIAVLGQLCAELIIWCLSWPLHKRNAWNKISSKSQLLQIAWWVLGLTLWKLTSPSPETVSPRLKKKNDSEIENAGPLVNQAVDLKTDSKTLYYCIL